MNHFTSYRPDGTPEQRLEREPDGTARWTYFATDGTVTGETVHRPDGSWHSRPVRAGRPGPWHPGPNPFLTAWVAPMPSWLTTNLIV